MTKRNLITASALALGLAIAASAAQAHGVGGFICQIWNPSKAAPSVTHCVTWTREATAQMRAAPCDPAKMSVGAMRDRCAELSAAADRAEAPAS
jgi:hypothetical protein